MTRILAVETGGDYASAAIYSDGAVSCTVFREKNRHTESLISLVDSVLGEMGLKAADVDAVAFGAGPGAFTGLRVACGVAQGLAWAVGKPTVPVVNPAAAAYALFARFPDIRRVAVINDARMHECYAAAYERDADGAPLEVQAPQLIAPEGVAVFLRESGAQAVIGTALEAYAREMALDGSVQAIKTEQTTAEDVVRLAAVQYARGQTTAPQLAAPLYVRNRVALTIEQRRAGEKL